LRKILKNFKRAVLGRPLGSLLFHVGSTGEKGHKKMPEKPKEAKMLMSGRPVSPQFFPLQL